MRTLGKCLILSNAGDLTSVTQGLGTVTCPWGPSRAHRSLLILFLAKPTEDPTVFPNTGLQATRHSVWMGTKPKLVCLTL